MNKDLIQTRFSKSLSTYNENAKIQKKMAEKLATLLNKTHYKKVLEIGCGTGFLTKLLNKSIDFESYTAIDIVSDCENYINSINPEINFIQADIEKFSLENYDLIIANASLQWVDDFKKMIKTLNDALLDGGEFVFSTFGKKNFREISLVTGTTLDYYSTNELKELFSESEIIQEVHIMTFKTPKEVLKHLQLTGVNAIENNIWTKKDLIKFENKYQDLCPTKSTLTYNPIYVKMTK